MDQAQQPHMQGYPQTVPHVLGYPQTVSHVPGYQQIAPQVPGHPQPAAHLSMYPQTAPLMGTNQGIQYGHPGFNVQPQPINYNQLYVRRLGITQIVIGILFLLLNVVLIGVRAGGYHVYNIGYGIWGGIVFFIAGFLSHRSGKGQPNRNLITFTMFMNIIAACLTPITLTFGLIDVGMSQEYKMKSFSFHHDTSFSTNEFNKTPSMMTMKDLSDVTLALAIIVVVLSILEAVISITSSACCYTVVCCSGPMSGLPYHASMTQVVVYSPNNPGPTAPNFYPGQNLPPGQPYNYMPPHYQEPHHQIPQFSDGSEVPSCSPPKYENTWNSESKFEGVN